MLSRSNPLPNRLSAVASAVTLAATGFMATAPVADAAISYGDISDIPPGAVVYVGVEEVPSSGSTPPLFNAPTASGSLLNFTPTNFSASSSDGVSGLADGQLSFTIDAEPGAGLTRVAFFESGEFSFTGATPTSDTSLSASTGATIRIVEVDGVALASPISVFESSVFERDYLTAGGSPSTGPLPWSLVTDVDLSSSLLPGSLATRLDVVFNNQLSSASTTGSQSTIAKTRFRVIPLVVVPEPTSLILLGVASCVLFRRGRGI